MSDWLIINARPACMDGTAGAGGPGSCGRPGLATVRTRDGLIAAVTAQGERRTTDDFPNESAGTRLLDAEERLVTPGLIDCHTHLIFAGGRAHEFEARLQGESYEDIARAGGGIAATVRATRAASEETLFALGRTRLRALTREGASTVEIKSGYGLNLETERRMLRVARALGAASTCEDAMSGKTPCGEGGLADVVTSFLGAHALPAQYGGVREEYIADLCATVLPAIVREGLADAVDGFCESIAFTCGEIETLFKCAQALGLPLKLHAEQLSNSGGAAMAARMGALSCDHLEYLDAQGVEAMAQSGTVATLLPGAYYYLGAQRKPPVAALREAGVPMAVASDLNPGSSPLFSPLIAMNMACVLFGLAPLEALAGMTCNAARALGLSDRGVLARGKRADLAFWDAGSPAELIHALGRRACLALMKRGAFLFGRDMLRARP